MNIEEERQRILELWYNNIKPEARGDLSNLWEHRAELGELEAIVERLEPKVIKLLEVIPTLKRHSPEYHARTRDLIKLLHHFNEYQSSEGWIQSVTSDLEYLSGEIHRVRTEAEKVLQSRRYSKESVTEDEKNKLIALWKQHYRCDEFKKNVEAMGYRFQTFNGRDKISGELISSENIYIISKGEDSYMFPAWNVKPGNGLEMYYMYSHFNYPIRDIRALAKVTFRGGEWKLVGNKGQTD